MSELEKEQLGKILWDLANELRGAMNADDFRDYMLSFLFLSYLSDHYINTVKKILGSDYTNDNDTITPLQNWYINNPNKIPKMEEQIIIPQEKQTDF